MRTDDDHGSKGQRKLVLTVLLFTVLVGASLFACYSCGSRSDRHPSEPSEKWTSRSGLPPSTGADSASPDKGIIVQVTQVTDGDTIRVRMPDGREEAVRYIGINTPELDQPYGQEAKEANRELVADRQVRLVKDVSDRDRYGRLLRYVYVNDLFVNAELVRRGYAQVSTYPPDVAFSELFLEMQRQAQAEGAGLWAPSSQPGASGIPWNEAASHSGETVTVVGPVMGAKYASSSKGKPTFLNIGVDYPDPRRFTVVIWGQYRSNFPSPPETFYLGKTVAVTGRVELYKGVPEIEVTSPDQIEIR